MIYRPTNQAPLLPSLVSADLVRAYESRVAVLQEEIDRLRECRNIWKSRAWSYLRWSCARSAVAAALGSVAGFVLQGLLP